MNEQKDNKKTVSINDESNNRHGNISIYNNAFGKVQYTFAHKKTEKLVTAVYMVTDCMDTGDALRGRLRNVSIDLLSLMHQLSVISPVEKNNHLIVSSSKIREMISLVDIATMIGTVSQMNAAILKKELENLATELGTYKTENEASSFAGQAFENRKIAEFVLNENMFEVGEKNIKMYGEDFKAMNPIKDIKDSVYPTAHQARTSPQAPHQKSPFVKEIHQKVHQNLDTIKTERVNKIIAIIKDKGEVSIKDISLSMSECSEKTIQREINDLIYKGQIKKTGEKRWSRYSM